jgi:hypothetical protein
VAYRVLTGHLPFDGDVPYVVISRHANEPPAPLRSLEPSVPRGVEQVVLKALAKRPGDRFQSMGSFARALAAIDEAGHGEAPAALLRETEGTTAAVAPGTEPLHRLRRPPPGRAAGPAAAEPAALDVEPRQTGPSESSDVGTPVTDLGTERLPARRRVSDVYDVEELRRAGITERVDEPSGELEAGAAAVRGSSGQVPVTAVTPVPPAARRWSGVVCVLGLVGLVTVAAAVGAIVARTQPEPVAPTPGITAAREGEAVASKGPREVSESTPVGAATAGIGEGKGEVGEASPTQAAVSAGDASPTQAAVSAGDASPTQAGVSAGDAEPLPLDDTTGDAPPDPAPAPRGSTRKPTDASAKKKLARELRRACGAGATGYRVKIEGLITAEGRITGARALEVPGDVRSCIERVVEAQRFPPGELRTLDLAVTL